MRLSRQIALSLLLIQLPIALAAPTTAPSQPNTAISIYSFAEAENFDATKMLDDGKIPGYAIIQQRRMLDLQEGENNFDLPDIAASADFSTFSLRPTTADAFKVLSQTLRPHATDPDSILQRAIGHEIIINRRQSGGAAGVHAPETINARLLAVDANQLVIETNNRQLPVQIIPRNSEIAEIKLMADSAAGTTHATLACKITAKETAPHEALLTYHAGKMTWHADYEIILDDNKPAARFSSAITIINRTGASFEDAAINLLKAQSTISYPMPGAATLPANSAQRIPLFDNPSIPTQTRLAVGPLDYARQGTTASTYLAIDNTSKNNLALSLPPGRLRIFRQNKLLTDTLLAPSEPNNLILIGIGTSNLVSAKREVQTRIDTDRPTIAIDSVQILLRSRADQPQRVTLIEPRLTPDSEILDKSDAFEKQSQSLLFTVDIPPFGEKTVTYTLRHPGQ